MNDGRSINNKYWLEKVIKPQSGSFHGYPLSSIIKEKTTVIKFHHQASFDTKFSLITWLVRLSFVNSSSSNPFGDSLLRMVVRNVRLKNITNKIVYSKVIGD